MLPCNILCPDCPGSDLAAQRRRVEQLSVEVDEARQENQRLNKQTNRLRVALQDARSVSSKALAGDEFGWAVDRGQRASGHPVGAANPADAVQDEVLRLQHTLWELQRENTLLKQGPGGDESSAFGQVGKGVTAAQYRQLQSQLEDLQRAHDGAAMQTEKMRLQQMYNQTPSPVNGDRLTRLTPPAVGTAPGRLGRLGSAAGSRGTSGVTTPADGGCRFEGIAGPMGSTSPLSEDEMLRKLQTIQAENEQLRRKVRMLASR